MPRDPPQLCGWGALRYAWVSTAHRPVSSWVKRSEIELRSSAERKRWQDLGRCFAQDDTRRQSGINHWQNRHAHGIMRKKVRFTKRRTVMNNSIVDGMKKEGKPFRNITIVAFVLFALTFLYPYVNNKSYLDKDVLIMLTAFLMYGLFSLYCWLYAATYRVEFNESKILLKTLFRKVEINLCDIEKYTCARYRKSVFYQFHFFTLFWLL